MNAIEQVKKAEARALEIVEEAKQKALDDLEFAHDYVKREKEQILSQAEEERELIFQRSRIDAQRQVDGILAEGAAVIEKLDALDDTFIQPALERILERILEEDGNC